MYKSRRRQNPECEVGMQSPDSMGRQKSLRYSQAFLTKVECRISEGVADAQVQLLFGSIVAQLGRVSGARIPALTQLHAHP